jgi:hypothetical protein
VSNYKTVTFIHLFNGSDITLKFVYLKMGNKNMMSELEKYVGESVVSNTKYGISLEVQRKTRGNLIQGSSL